MVKPKIFRTFLLPLCVALSVTAKGRVNWSAGIGHDSTVNVGVGLLTNVAHVRGLSLNVISGHAHKSVGGMQLSGLINISGGATNGFQIAGLSNITAGRQNGLALSGIVNLTQGEVYGLQLSGISNVAGRGVHGLQLSGLMNASGGTTRGLQLSTLSNMSRRLHGLQIAALTNIGFEGAGGTQIAGATNIINEGDGILQLAPVNISMQRLRGLQLGGMNYSGGLRGAQIGIVNIAAGDVGGLQLGIINISQDTTVTKLGLVNVFPGHTRVQMLVYGGNTTKTNVAARFTNRHLYTIIGGGTHYMGFSRDFSGSLFYRSGITYHISPRWSLYGDLGYVHIETFEDEADKPKRLYALQIRAGAEWQMNSKVSFFANTGYSQTRYYHHSRMQNHKPIVELGIALF